LDNRIRDGHPRHAAGHGEKIAQNERLKGIGE